MNNGLSTAKLIGLVLLLLLVYSSAFQVEQTQYALKLRLGKVVNADYAPGLHFKFPMLEKVRYFDNRIQSLDANPEEFLTREKKNVIVDSFVKWRIVDPLQYFTSMGGDEVRASDRLRTVIADDLRNKFGTRTIQEVISGDRATIMTEITSEANERVTQFGIEIIDLRLKRIELPEKVSDSVYRRMEAERERVAKELRSRGEAEAVRIRAEADRTRVEVLAKAKRDSDIARGKGEADASRIYAEAYNQNPEFYAFYRSLAAYRESFDNKSDILVLEPDSDFFEYFRSSNPASQP